MSYFGVVYSREFDGFVEDISKDKKNMREYVPIPSIVDLNAQD